MARALSTAVRVARDAVRVGIVRQIAAAMAGQTRE
jgi:hypothetical protein